MSKLEIRTMPVALDAVSTEGKMPTLSGYALTYDNLSQDLGGFREIIRPGAIVPRNDVRALVSHDRNSRLGRTSKGTLQLASDNKGLRFTLQLPDTTLGRDVAAMVGHGDLDGMSFGFLTKRDKWSYGTEGTIRELLAVDLHEISLTDDPAYLGTSVSVRALEQAKQFANYGNKNDLLQFRLKVACAAYIHS